MRCWSGKQEAAAIIYNPDSITGVTYRFRVGLNGPTLAIVGMLVIMATAILVLTATGNATIIGPQGSYTEVNNTDVVEVCSSLDASFNCVNDTTTFPAGATVYVRISTPRVPNALNTNQARLVNYLGTNIRTGTFTQRSSSSPYVYTAALVIPSTTNYFKVYGLVRSSTAGNPRFQFEEHLNLASLPSQYMNFYKAPGRVGESYTFQPSATVYITAYGRNNTVADSTNNYARLTNFTNTSFNSINPGTVNPDPTDLRLYNFTYTMPALGTAIDGEWYWLATRLRTSGGTVVERMSRMIQIDGSNPAAGITAPAQGAFVYGLTTISGFATDLYSFESWVLEYGAGASPSSWTQIGADVNPVNASSFIDWDTTGVADGQYTIRLTVVDRAGNTAQDARLVNVDNNPPVISGIGVGPLASATATVYWATNEAADSYIEYDTDSGTPYGNSLSDASMTTSHSLALGGLNPNTVYYYRLHSTDAAGHETWTAEASFHTASIMVLQPSPSLGKDTSIESGQPSFNRGAEAYLRAADDAAMGTTRSALQFDLSGIPAGSTIVSATMALYQMGQGDASTPTLEVHALNRNWTEGTGTGSATGDGATWLKYDGANDWPLAGGDFNPAAAASSPGLAVSGDWVNWSLTGLTQSWVNSAATNYGALIKQDTESAGNDIKVFYAADYAGDASHRPKLVIEWLGNDATGPHIDEVRAEDINQTGATIKWSTDENSDSQVEYGTTTSYGSLTALDPAWVNQHAVSLSTLTADTVFHYRVRSTDPSGNETISGDHVFQTARVIVIQPDQYHGADSWLNSAQTTFNYGADTDLSSGDNGAAGPRRPLIKFDLSQIPAGSTINSATLSVYQHAQADTSTPNISAYDVSGAWAEGTGFGSETADGATWTTYDGVHNWTAPGGDFGAAQCTASAPNSSGAWFNLACMQGLVQSWIDAPATNQGVIIKKPTEAPAATDFKIFYSSDYAADTSLRPKLTIEYVPVPGSMTMSVDETWNRDASYGAGSVGFGNVTAGSTFYVGNGSTPQYAVKLSIWSNTTWGLKLAAFDDLKQSNPANFISIANLAWDDSDNPAGYQAMVKSPAETVIVSAMTPTAGSTYRFDYRLALPSLAVSGNYSVPLIYTVYPS